MTLITATARLARELRREYDRGKVDAGLATWPTADILPLTAWLRERWRDWLYGGQHRRPLRLLTKAEEQAIWEDIVGSEEGSGLLQLGATADAALSSWDLLCSWNLPMDAPEWTDSASSEVFHHWADEFLRRLEDHGWLSASQLPGFISERVEALALPLPKQVEIAGFLEFTPGLERLFRSLAGRGVQVDDCRIAHTVTHAVRIGLLDRDTEIWTAARWAARSLEGTDGDCRIGIIVPDLGACRSQVERIFSETFHPNKRLRPDFDTRRLFNLSLGRPATDYPLIQAALFFLRLKPEALPLDDAGRLLRSAFIEGADGESSQRALLDRDLRRLGEPEVGFDQIVAMAEDPASPNRCPRLGLRLRQWKEKCDVVERVQRPSDWAESLSGCLDALGWPGDGPLDSAEFQTMEVWNELLSQLANLDAVAGKVRWNTAVRILNRLAVSRQFQPESEPAPVQIMGLFEASGLRFDHLWIMGMHDDAWPATSNPDPFLPLRLQRRFNLPRSSADRELDFARLLTRRLLASASTLVVSHPRRDAESDLRVSPLLASLSEVDIADLPMAPGNRYVNQLVENSRMEILEDDNGGPFGRISLAGGTTLFKHQAACPFRAFALLRLGAQTFVKAEVGLSALDRGMLLHDVLERLWAELGSHHGLVARGEEALAALIRVKVRGAIHDMSRRRRVLHGARFASIERERLEQLLTEWLAIEKERQPFTVLRQEEGSRVLFGGIEVRVRADRVDQLENGTSVIVDYKSGDYGPSRWQGRRPDEPQLPVYAATAQAPVAGVFFANLKAGRVGFRGLTVADGIVPRVKLPRTGPSLEERIEGWRAVLKGLAEDFRAGRARVDPKKPNETCQLCPLPAFCRIGEARNVAEDAPS